MNKKFLKFNYVAVFLTSIYAVSIPAIANADWSITALEALGNVNATSINDSGQVVGNSFVGESFITGPNGVGISNLGSLAGGFTSARGINDSGQVVGGSGPHAFITGPNGVGMTDLGTLGGPSSRAISINNSGQVVGSSTPAGFGVSHAFITGPNGVGMTDLGTLGGISSVAFGINDSGQVVGDSTPAGLGLNRAFITGPNGVGMTDLGALIPNRLAASGANDINESGQVVGLSEAAANFQAFVTGPNGVNMTNLGTLGGGSSSAAAINDAGQVVGTAFTAFSAGSENHAFIFSNGGMTDLSLLDVVVSGGWAIREVTDINNNGQIVGFGEQDGVRKSFLLSFSPDTEFTPQPIFIPITSIPEPETYAMFLAGLGLLGYLTWRRKPNLQTNNITTI